MIGRGPFLKFPRLVFAGRRKDRRGKTTPVYQLDWEPVESARSRRHDALMARMPGGVDDPLPLRPVLPLSYQSDLDAARFAIKPDYHAEIVRNARRAVEEWSHPRPFDTIVRDWCLQTAHAHVDVASSLLFDCLQSVGDEMDYERNYDRRQILTSAFLWRIWSGQTGAGHLWELAHLRILGISLDSSEREQLIEKMNPEMATYVRAMEDYVSKLYAEREAFFKSRAPGLEDDSPEV